MSGSPTMAYGMPFPDGEPYLPPRPDVSPQDIIDKVQEQGIAPSPAKAFRSCLTELEKLIIDGMQEKKIDTGYGLKLLKAIVGARKEALND